MLEQCYNSRLVIPLEAEREQSYGGSEFGVKSAKSHESIILMMSIILIDTLVRGRFEQARVLAKPFSTCSFESDIHGFAEVPVGVFCRNGGPVASEGNSKNRSGTAGGHLC